MPLRARFALFLIAACAGAGASAAAATAAAAAPAPAPVWHPVFYTTFNETTSILVKTFRTRGEWYYDSDSGAELVFRDSGLGDRYCGSVHVGVSTPCAHLVTGCVGGD